MNANTKQQVTLELATSIASEYGMTIREFPNDITLYVLKGDSVVWSINRNLLFSVAEIHRGCFICNGYKKGN